MQKALLDWRMLHPVSGVRQTVIPPPGWRAPKDWTQYMQRLEDLQPHTNIGMVPSEGILRSLDWMHGESGRLIYNCEPYPLLGGGLCK